METAPLFSVIIPVYQDVTRLRLALSSLVGQLPEGQIEILVVDNEGSAEVRELVTALPNARYLYEPEPGSYSARNRGVASAQGTILAFTDSDCRPDPNWLSNGWEAFRSDPSISVGGGRIRVFPCSESRPTVWECVDMANAFRQQHSIEQRGVAVTANLMARREVFAQAGHFDARLKSGADTAWCRSARDAGFPVRYLPDAIVEHPARPTRAEHRRKVRRVIEGLYERTRLSPEAYPLRAQLRPLLLIPVGIVKRAARDPRVPRRYLVPVACAVLELHLYKLWCWARCLAGQERLRRS